ncbi:hypothetical protein ACB092_03G020400 [Castanea dentata]
MKTILVVLFSCGLLLICIQGDPKRFLLEELTNGATDLKPTNQPEKSSTKGNPLLGSVPTVDANNKNRDSNISNKDNNSEDDKNESYGSHGNPSGSSTERHYNYITACQPYRENC